MIHENESKQHFFISNKSEDSRAWTCRKRVIFFLNPRNNVYSMKN